MQVKISESGLMLSRIVAGVMKWGTWGANFSAREILGIIEHCLEQGVTSFDHADIYGHYTTEALFGAAIKNKSALRNSMQLITKCGINLVTPNRPENKIKSYNSSEEHILKSVERSLINLHTDYIDLLLIHRPSPLTHPSEIAEAFTKLKATGKVLHFGVSNFLPSQFAALHQFFPLCTNQVEASLLHLNPMEDGTFDQAIQLNTRPMVWSPLGGGALFSQKPNTMEKRILETAKVLCEKYDIGLDQLLLSWLLKHPAGLLPVLGTSKNNRITDAVKAIEVDLTDEDWFRLLEAAKGAEVA